MGITRGFVGAVGNTPLIRLEHLSERTGCEILGKAEFMNPGGSVKDRAALGILLAAEASGDSKPAALWLRAPLHGIGQRTSAMPATAA